MPVEDFALRIAAPSPRFPARGERCLRGDRAWAGPASSEHSALGYLSPVAIRNETKCALWSHGPPFPLLSDFLKNRATATANTACLRFRQERLRRAAKHQRGLRPRGACFGETIARFREASLAGPCIHFSGSPALRIPSTSWRQYSTKRGSVYLASPASARPPSQRRLEPKTAFWRFARLHRADLDRQKGSN